MAVTEKFATRVYLDPPLMDWLRAEATRRHCSLSQVVRDLIVDRLAATKGGANELR
jgi:hypothetical protein